jgi:lipoprotein-anchoring transpeptidase ErfK/SrfK
VNERGGPALVLRAMIDARRTSLRSLAALALALALAALLVLPPAAQASDVRLDDDGAEPTLEIEISKAAQQMSVYLDGQLQYVFTVSTGKRGHGTPSGTFRVLWLNRMAYAPKYDNAPMPWSIFFTRAGHAIHETGHLQWLGRPVSHGCVRLPPEAAAYLYALVQQVGKRNTVIRIY